MNDLQRVSGSGGSRLYDGANTYKTSDGTLNKGTISIFIRANQAAMITSMKINGIATTLKPVGSDLLAGDFYTFSNEITEIVIAGGSFIGYQG